MCTYTLDGTTPPQTPLPLPPPLMASKPRAGLYPASTPDQGKRSLLAQWLPLGPESHQLKFRESEMSRSLSPTFTRCPFPQRCLQNIVQSVQPGTRHLQGSLCPLEIEAPSGRERCRVHFFNPRTENSAWHVLLRK